MGEGVNGTAVLSDIEKKEIIRSVLGANHNAVGKHFPIFFTGMVVVAPVLKFIE